MQCVPDCAVCLEWNRRNLPPRTLIPFLSPLSTRHQYPDGKLSIFPDGGAIQCYCAFTVAAEHCASNCILFGRVLRHSSRRDPAAAPPPSLPFHSTQPVFSSFQKKKNGHYTAVPVKSGSPMVERRFWLRVHRYEHGAFAGAGSAYWDLARGQCGAVHGAAHLCCDDPAARIRRTEPVDSRGDSPYVTSTLRFPSVNSFTRRFLQCS